MKLILQDNNAYVLNAGVGEEIIGELREFCRENKIEAGKFFAIGAAKEVRIGWYDVDTKEYTWKEYKEKLEVVSLLGNIAWKENEVIAHAHGSFSNRQMEMMGGHVAKLVVGGACEVMLTKFAGHIKKAYDEQTGLNLMK